MSGTVTITEAEYARLCAAAEEGADMHAARSVAARLAAGAEELLPAEVADRLIDGHNPLRGWRTYRGISQSYLARSAGVSRVQINEIEAGARHRICPDAAIPRRCPPHHSRRPRARLTSGEHPAPRPKSRPPKASFSPPRLSHATRKALPTDGSSFSA